MAEFKKIADVDVINTLNDDDNVVVIGSDGALKQTSSKNIKGSASIILRPQNFYYNEDEDCLCVEDNYDELYDALMSGVCVWIDSTEHYATMGWGDVYNPSSIITNSGTSYNFVSCWTITDIGLVLETWNYKLVFPNGSHNLPRIEQNLPS